MIDVKVKINGIEDFINRLSKVTPEKQSKILTSAMVKGGNIIAAEAKKLAPKKTGELRAAIRVVKAKTKPGTAKVSVQVGQGDFKGDEYYAAFQEFGWRQGKRPSRSKYAKIPDTRKQIPGKHYMERATTTKGEAAIEAITTDVSEQLDKEFNQ